MATGVIGYLGDEFIVEDIGVGKNVFQLRDAGKRASSVHGRGSCEFGVAGDG